MPTIRYKVPLANKYQPDLMVATPVYDRVKKQGAVGLTFRHALAAISFSVNGDPSRAISAVNISNVVPAATLSLDSLNIAWSDLADRSTTLCNLGIKDGNTAPSYGGVTTPITASNGYLMMIPQDITKVKIEVKVNGETELIDLKFKPDSEWVAEAKYNYIIDLETETIECDITQTSNCYIVDNATVKEVYIPINQRINTFWRDYSGLGLKKSAKYMIDYDPDSPAHIATSSKIYNVKQGEIHRYTLKSPNWDTGIYFNSFTMDRDIGSHNNMSENGLFYQWGRKDPFSTIKSWTTLNGYVTFATAVQNPTIFYTSSTTWCSEPSGKDYKANDYLWYDIKKLNPQIHIEIKKLEKSIFDPSPLGWCVPLRVAYSDWKWRSDYKGIVNFDITDHIFPKNGEIKKSGTTTSLWFAGKGSDGNADHIYVESDSFNDRDICIAYGHRIRPVKITN